MVSRRRIITISTAVVAVGAWYAFRPERLFVNKTVNETFPAGSQAQAAVPAAPTTLATGRFHTNAHETKGTATVYRIADGRRILRLEQFETSNGPDVHVYLVAAADVQQDATVKTAGFVDLGSIKGNRGDQNYDVPADVDLAKYRAATIWCRRFSVNFGTAPLAAAR
ncbi:MAG: hypothetical protein DMD69_10325 [Gemmatimonadetes bacterium]|nr:MAG: hypothetical protein DMD69_10325 [Gemmatimonadota bacterium]PYP26216.1 MAG: hypothetical protein DMD55_10910 [Gemmatimonadota bacterium]